MKPIALQQLLNWIPGATLRCESHIVLEKYTSYGVSTDTRTIRNGNVFVALKGEKVDGHQYLELAARNKAALALVSYNAPQVLNNTVQAMPWVLVPDTGLALQQLATAYRQQFKPCMAVVTGSNGKTTVKEMVHSIFKAQCASMGNERAAHCTVGNFNNEIGLPLTLLKLNPHHLYSVVELGMNHPGETAQLAAIAQADIALINNAQREHQEFMQTVEAVAKEHGDVIHSLSAQGVVVIPADDTYSALWRELAGARRVVDFALHKDGDTSTAVVTGRTQEQGLTQTLVLNCPSGQVTIQLQALGEHNAKNALAAAAVAVAAGIALANIVRGLEAFNPVKGRMQYHQVRFEASAVMYIAEPLTSTFTLIDDTYNANPDSVAAAIRVLDGLAQSPKTQSILILGDMGEVGTQGEAFHQEAGQLAANSKISQLFTLGSLSQSTHEAFKLSGKPCQHFVDVASMVAAVEQVVKPQDTVLVKASRFMRFETVVESLLKSGQVASQTHTKEVA